jgi:hypothetical protein
MLEGGQRSWKFAVPPAAIGFVAGNARLRDRVADNAAKNDITESESLLIGRTSGSAPTSRPPRTEACSWGR